MRRRRTLATLVLALALGCARGGTVLIDGRPVPRQTSDWTGSPYAVRLSNVHPRPGEPSGGLVASGGMLTGVVCGVSLDYEVYHRGPYVEVVGQLDNDANLPSALRMAGDADIRVVKGRLGSRVVDFKMTRDRIEGFVGRRAIQYHREGDEYRFSFQVGNALSVEVHHVIKGADELWRMPPVVQAVVVPLVAACLYAPFEDPSRPPADPPAARFGGPTGAVPAGTLVFR